MSIRNYEMNLNQDSDQEDELFDENCIEIIRDDVNFQQEGSDVSDEDYINETNEDDNCDDDGFLEQQKVLNEIVFLDDSIQGFFEHKRNQNEESNLF